MSEPALFTPDYKSEPYWWERTPRPQLDPQPPPEHADVAIVGSGYTGLCAAIQTARAGRHTVVLDGADAGWGCSTRNGGQVSTSIKPSFEELARRFGTDGAYAVLREGHRALEWIAEFISDEGIDCDFARVGRFHGAHNRISFAALADLLANQPRGLETETELVTRDQQPSELGSDFYHGGVVYPQHASLDPARYHRGLLERALAAGVSIHPHCEVRAIRSHAQGHQLETGRGSVSADQVLVATSGYTGAVTRWLQRRVIPIGSYIIATEPLPRAQMDRLMPRNRVISDTRRLVCYYRASPDRQRILFGGRVSLAETDPGATAGPLRTELARIFPELATVRVSHSWMGFVGYTFDKLPHPGCHDGIYYALGYCGSGVSLASYFGTRVAQQLLGLPEGRTGLDQVRFPSRAYYWGRPWFLAPSIRYYRWRDQT